MEQLVVRERLTLDVLVRLSAADDGLIRDVLYWGFTHGLKIDFERVEARLAPGPADPARGDRARPGAARRRRWPRSPMRSPRPAETSTGSSGWPPIR